MHIHLLGICGTFMAGIAALGDALGDKITGSDTQAYPPMSNQLAALGIDWDIGYEAKHLVPEPDMIVVGNALSRGNPAIEAMLDRKLRFSSGPAWLYQRVLQDRIVLAVSGTHGKTTTASMLAWILEYACLNPGFLIGGIPQNFGISARLGGGKGCPFVVEADEYDTSFFDKRSKFVHYYPQILVINNIEFDHADIFDSIADIRRQFHHLIRTIPGNGCIIANTPDEQIDRVLAMGIWTPVQRCGISSSDWNWNATSTSNDYRSFTVSDDRSVGHAVRWSLIGQHNARNAVAAIAAAVAFGVEPAIACTALASFKGVHRRLEMLGTPRNITLYDDFAHHPTAIAVTLKALRTRVGAARILAVVDLASNTMRSGIHRDTLGAALAAANIAWIYARADSNWDPQSLRCDDATPLRVSDSITDLVAAIVGEARPGDHLVIMSNSAFMGIHQTLLQALAQQS